MSKLHELLGKKKPIPGDVGIEIELITTEVKINEGVTDADFK